MTDYCSVMGHEAGRGNADSADGETPSEATTGD